ncbi:hypothetical protein D9Q81_09385 [Candidatus Korarchaeum cryptofilum]|uniref:Uncharacterized protein n=1 Tax=Candidatus Korarchaeum cryptofilum TaxID=498846 RepID=A0A429FZT0_9CREN|nr:hypothetical protein D9Q81_09385 [Candidatus Korarchaeum cryptofilum]
MNLTSTKPRPSGRGKVFKLLFATSVICHIPESQGAKSEGQLLARDRGNGLKTQPVVYHWTSGAGWVRTAPTSCEVMKMKAVNHEPVSRPEGTLRPSGRGGGQQHLRAL